MGVTLGTYGATDSTGWTVFTNPTAVYYVSDSLGSDSNTGANPTNAIAGTGPFLTTAAAHNAALAAGAGDRWILLRRGDTFTNQNLTNDIADGTSNISGTSATAPFVWSNYDETIAVNTATGFGVNPAASANARPVVKTQPMSSGFATSGGAGGDYVAIVGIDFYNWRADPDNPSYGSALYTIAVNAGGSGYSVNDVITLTNSNGSMIDPPKLRVTGVSAGAVTTITIIDRGSSTINSEPTAYSQASVLPAGGTGATFNTATYQFPTNGSGVQLRRPTPWMLIEDCRFRYLVDGIDPSSPPPDYNTQDVYIRRNVFEKNYGNGVHGGAANLVVDENVFYHNGYVGTGVPSVFNHNMYIDFTARRADTDVAMNPATVRGNIFIEGSSSTQFRNGGTWSDNCLIAEGGGHNIGNYLGGANEVSDNVYLEFKAKTTGASEGVFPLAALGDVAYIGNYIQAGTCSVTGNIFTTTLDATGSGIDNRLSGANGWTCSNNIFYKWAPSSLSSVSDAIQFSSGSILTLGNITAGSGYTDLAKTISGVSRESTAGGYDYDSNNVVLTVNNITGINAFSDGASLFYVDGIVGTIGSELNGNTYTGACWDSTHIILYGTGSVSGSYTSGGSIYYPYYNYPLSGGTTPASADFIVAGGGVVAVRIQGSSGPTHDNTPNDAGAGYAVNDTLTSPSLDTDAGGTNFSCKVTALRTNTVDGTNILDTGAGGGTIDSDPATYPDPNRTSGSYYNSLYGGSGATYLDFTTVALANTKNTWDYRLTANNGINPYIRAGFGVGISLTPSTLPGGTENVSYSQALTAGGGSAPYTFSVISGALPTGLSLDTNTGVISGTPSAAATYAFTVEATDSISATGSQAYSVVIAAASVTPTPTGGGGGTGKGRGKKKNILGLMIDYLKQKMNSLLGRSSS